MASKGMEIETKDGETFLVREVVDRPHSYGILDRLNGLGLEPPSLETLPDAHGSPGGRRGPKGSEL